MQRAPAGECALAVTVLEQDEDLLRNAAGPRVKAREHHERAPISEPLGARLAEVRARLEGDPKHHFVEVARRRPVLLDHLAVLAPAAAAPLEHLWGGRLQILREGRGVRESGVDRSPERGLEAVTPLDHPLLAVLLNELREHPVYDGVEVEMIVEAHADESRSPVGAIGKGWRESALTLWEALRRAPPPPPPTPTPNPGGGLARPRALAARGARSRGAAPPRVGPCGRVLPEVAGAPREAQPASGCGLEGWGDSVIRSGESQ